MQKSAAMPSSSESEFVSHLLDLLQPIGGITARRMFGGCGLFRSGIMFGLLADGVFFLKTDEINRPEFSALGMPPFRYEGKAGRVSVMSYNQCPEEALDHPAAMRPWAESAIAAAARANEGKRKAAPSGKSLSKRARK